MAVFVCKRYRRSTPGAETGALLDEFRFEADSQNKAETWIRKVLRPPIAPMDWVKDFATLEDEDGHVLVTWLYGFLHG
jgi:hypothetical protein